MNTVTIEELCAQQDADAERKKAIIRAHADLIGDANTLCERLNAAGLDCSVVVSVHATRVSVWVQNCFDNYDTIAKAVADAELLVVAENVAPRWAAGNNSIEYLLAGFPGVSLLGSNAAKVLQVAA